MSKKTTTVLAVIILLAMILTGTFAWVQYNQHKTNEASGSGLKYDVTLIEDFQEIENWKVSNPAVKKEIRVKNTGLTDGSYGDVYVRLQLKEYLEMAPLIYEYTDYRLMIGTDGNFIKYASEAEARAAYGSDHTIVPLQGWEDDKTYYYVQTKAGDDNGQYGKYLLMDITSEKAVSLIDGVKRATKADADHHLATNGECAYPVHVWKATPSELEDCELGFHEYIKWFLGDDVITMDEWLTTYGGSLVEKWICDTDSAQGWVYWGMPLSPGETTSNLLEKVRLIKQPEGNFYYALHVDMKALSRDEIAGGNGLEWGDAPAEIVVALSGSTAESGVTEPEVTEPEETEPEETEQGEADQGDADQGDADQGDTEPIEIITDVTVSPGTVTVQRGQTKEFTVTVTGENNPRTTVTWTIEGGNGSSYFTGNVLTVGSGETLGTLTVRATSTVDESKFGEALVTVTAYPDWAISAGVTGVTADIGKPFAVDGYTWRILTVDGSGNMLVTTATLTGTSTFRSLGTGNNYTNSELESAMTTFYNNSIPILKTYAKPVTLTTETAASWSTSNKTLGLSSVASSGDPIAFALSVSEINSYFGSDATDKKATLNGVNTSYWLRSLSSYTDFASVVAYAGVVDIRGVDVTIGMRPALWIHLQS